MNKRTLRVIEYNKIIDQLTGYAASPMAKKKCERLKPRRELSIITAMQQQTRDALLRLEREGNISFAGLRDIGAVIKRLEVKGILNIKELLDVASVLDTTQEAAAYGSKTELLDIKEDCLTESFNLLVPLSHITSEIHRCILSETEIADDASSALKSIRRNKKLTNDRLHTQLTKMIADPDKQSMFQENLITIRNGRYCIPVKSEYKNSFPGLIHDQSGSGKAVFIEPLVVVNMNNELKELENQELLEIERILENLSVMAAAEAANIKYNFDTLIELDFIFARARFARAYNGTEPVFNTEGIVDLRDARHPLLDKHKVVPVNIKLGEDYKLLIVTGPNTGGKTVSLKTLGLLTLMGQSGLHIPALHGSRLNVFDDVFADIGDEQSIEQNLSTFSSHMSNIVYIVTHVTSNSLCLFDELGGGTDPVEGAALAMSILGHLNDIDVRCMATTHYSELKTFAMTTPGVQNASCEFDLSTLMPTYRLTIGIPGKSNAFAISKKLGLPEYIISRARESLDSNTVDFETILAELEQSRRDMEQDKEVIARDKEEIKQLKERLTLKDSEIKEKKAEILAKARAEAQDIIEEAKETADSAIRKYNKWSANPHKADAKSMEKEREKLRTKLSDYNQMSAAKRKTLKSEHKAADFKVGDTVHVISMDTTGTITAPADSKGNLTVSMGILNATLKPDDLVILDTPKAAAPKQKTASEKSFGKALTIHPEINVLGMTVAEATSVIDKYLDDAVLAKLHQVTIIHGKGTGALKKGIHEYLRHDPHVATFRLGTFGEGDAGVTIVELR
jgi:DNA mismatch repair protein MutS2